MLNLQDVLDMQWEVRLVLADGSPRHLHQAHYEIWKYCQSTSKLHA